MSDFMKYATLVIFLIIVFGLMWILKDGFPRNRRGPRDRIVEQRTMLFESTTRTPNGLH